MMSNKILTALVFTSLVSGMVQNEVPMGRLMSGQMVQLRGAQEWPNAPVLIADTDGKTRKMHVAPLLGEGGTPNIVMEKIVNTAPCRVMRGRDNVDIEPECERRTFNYICNTSTGPREVSARLIPRISTFILDPYLRLDYRGSSLSSYLFSVCNCVREALDTFPDPFFQARFQMQVTSYPNQRIDEGVTCTINLDNLDEDTLMFINMSGLGNSDRENSFVVLDMYLRSLELEFEREPVSQRLNLEVGFDQARRFFGANFIPETLRFLDIMLAMRDETPFRPGLSLELAPEPAPVEAAAGPASGAVS